MSMTTMTSEPVALVTPDGARLMPLQLMDIPADVWEALPRPAANFIAVMQSRQPKMSKGGILFADSTRDDRESMDFVGQVVAMGPTCFQHPSFMVAQPYEADDGSIRYRQVLPEPRCRVGDWVLFKRHEQMRVPVFRRDAARTEEDVVVRLTIDNCIVATAPSPDQLKVYIV